MDFQDGNDPIWGTEAKLNYQGIYTLFDSARSGCYFAQDGFADRISGYPAHRRAVITTWILEHNRVKETPHIDPSVLDRINGIKELTISQKIDKFLLMLESNGYRVGNDLPWGRTLGTTKTVAARNEAMRWIEAASDDEFYAFKDVLIDSGILVEGASQYRLGKPGYERMDVLRMGGANSKQAFVAMWFDESTRPIYDEAIEPALRELGYQPIRIDQKEHVNKIDDEIVAEIRRSKFLVADFTSGSVVCDGGSVLIPRGGVYYEAGLAHGLGMPVIWMVREDQIGLVHFDTRQYNHLTWRDASDLKPRLINRVAAVIGYGSTF